MMPLALHTFHTALHAQFTEVNGMEVVNDYGDYLAEHSALRHAAGVIDLSFRGRLVLTGADRVRLLNGQVTNDVKSLPVGQGCYAALITNKGRMQSDLNIYILPEEILLDFEPGLSSALLERFNKFIIADDVEVLDVASEYGLLSVQGPKAQAVIESAELNLPVPANEFQSQSVIHEGLGEIYCMNQSRIGLTGFDLFVPTSALAEVAKALTRAAVQSGGRLCGWQALEAARIEAAIPRFGAEMDQTNLPPETGIESRAISYSKGCYIGQEIIARIRTYGQVARSLRGFTLKNDLKELPAKGDKIYLGNKEVGYLCSALRSPALNANIALGYVRREHNQIGAELHVRTLTAEIPLTIVEIPFVRRE